MRRHKVQARQLYEALRRRGQTWAKSPTVLEEWANEFEGLQEDVGNRKHIQRVLDWYCEFGCGALFVPSPGTSSTFREKFDELNSARKWLKGRPLIYFDDLLSYKLARIYGTAIQQEMGVVQQKVAQRIKFTSDSIEGKIALPAPTTSLRADEPLSEHHTNTKPASKRK